MAQVFISHAHCDETLARKVASLLDTALRLDPADTFISSEAGHGVAPGANILESIVSELQRVPALVVLLTPTSLKSPWVWLEAGSRLCLAKKTLPIFVVPSGRVLPLPEPVAEWRCLRLDRDGDLHELVQAVGKSLARRPRDVLDYKSALDDVLQGSVRTDRTERRAQVSRWVIAHGLGLALAVAGLVMLGYGWHGRSEAQPTDTVTLWQLNDTIAKTASKFLELKGRVTSGESGVHGAVVMVSRVEAQDPSACIEPECTQTTTTTEGEFTIDLTKILANRDERVVLSVAKSGFEFFSKAIEVDVRAMDVSAAPQTVKLIPQS